MGFIKWLFGKKETDEDFKKAEEAAAKRAEEMTRRAEEKESDKIESELRNQLKEVIAGLKRLPKLPPRRQEVFNEIKKLYLRATANWSERFSKVKNKDYIKGSCQLIDKMIAEIEKENAINFPTFPKRPKKAA